MITPVSSKPNSNAANHSRSSIEKDSIFIPHLTRTRGPCAQMLVDSYEQHPFRLPQLADFTCMRLNRRTPCVNFHDSAAHQRMREKYPQTP